jgi:hypothetical protein
MHVSYLNGIELISLSLDLLPSYHITPNALNPNSTRCPYLPIATNKWNQGLVNLGNLLMMPTMEIKVFKKTLTI